MSNHVTNWDKVNQETKTVNESLTAELERYKERVKTFEQRLNVDLSSHEKLIDSQMDDMIQNRNALKQEIDSLKHTLSKQLNKLAKDFGKYFVLQMQLSAEQVFWLPLSNPKSEQLDVTQTSVEIEVPKEHPKVVKVRTTPDTITEGSWGFEHTKHVFKEEVYPFINSLRASFKDFENGLHNVMNIVMHADSVPINVLPENNKCLVDNNLESKRLIQENDHLFELLLSQDIVHICVNSLATLTNYAKMEQDYFDEYSKNQVLKAELAKKEQTVENKFFDKVVLSCSRLENHNVNLELKLQYQKESFLNNRSFNNQNAPENLDFFKINEWQAKLDAKDVSIANLRKHIESIKGNNVVDNDVQLKNQKVIAPEMFKLDLEPLAPKEVLVYVTATCPSLSKPSEKLVAVTPLNKNKKVRLAEPATSSSNTQKQVVQIVLWYLDSRCTKHMTGNRSQLINFVHKFLGTVRFGNDQIAKIMGYGDYQMGNVTISQVYYVEG
ncbi:hypothetical protein Tco_1409383 [Tanacetum coccineum]